MLNNITIIILNYKKYDDLRRAIFSIKEQKGLENFNVKIHITDNGSGDDCTKRIEKEFPENSYLYNTQNVGFARGVNQAIRQNPDSDYFLLMNDDAVLHPDCLRFLLVASNTESIAGPAIFYKHTPNIIWQGGGYFSSFKMGLAIPEKNKRLIQNNTENVGFLSGCLLLIPKKVIDKIGYLDEKFFFYGEDLDFCLRALNAGIKIKYVREARAWHNIGNIEQNRTNTFVLKNLAIAYFLITKKHFKSLEIYSLFLFLFVYTPFRVFQIAKGDGNIMNIKSWFLGGKIGWQTKI